MRQQTNIPANSPSFYAMFDSVLLKAVEEGDDWVIYLKASNESIDRQQEVVLCKALQRASSSFLAEGVISWDHKHKQKHDPKYIIGEPLDVRFTGDRETLVKGKLYKANDIAQSVWKNVLSGTSRFGSSVGGYVLQKSGNTAASVWWDEVAVTDKPMNAEMLGGVTVVPFREFAKALLAGGGVDAAAFTGGRALTAESLMGATSDLTHGAAAGWTVPEEDLKELFQDLLVAIKDGTVETTNDMVAFVLDQGYPGSVAATIVEFLYQKLPGAAQALRR